MTKSNKPSNSNRPILDLYEYEIFGYPKDLVVEDMSRFNEIKTVRDKTDCGLVRTGNSTEASPYATKVKSSCDLIYSDPFENQNNIFIQSKSKNPIKTSAMYDQIYYQISPKSTDQLEAFYKNFNFAQDLLSKAMDSIRNYKGLSKLNLDRINIGDALVYPIEVFPHDKIIIFGDLHGSFHTFWRHIKRLIRAGILKKDFVLAENYRLIFLGDIFDRGQHALEIFLLIIQLIQRNNTPTQLNVIYNRGNHESPEMYQSESLSLKSELRAKKIPDPVYTEYFVQLGEFFRMSPSALVLLCPSGDKIWLSHGGFPCGGSSMSGGASLEPQTTEPLESLESFETQIKNLDSNSSVIWLTKDSTFPTQIRWNDFTSQPKTTFNSTRGGSRNVPIYTIGTDDITRFITSGAISYVIRGHQDFPNNSFIVAHNASNTDYVRFIPGRVENDNLEDNDFLVINKNYFEVQDKRKAVFGPVARIQLNSQPNPITLRESTIRLYPVITLSTNTDINRPLVHDSFGLLRFDLTSPTISDMQSNQIGGYIYHQKYLKYKEKYARLKSNMN